MVDGRKCPVGDPKVWIFVVWQSKMSDFYLNFIIIIFFFEKRNNMHTQVIVGSVLGALLVFFLVFVVIRQYRKRPLISEPYNVDLGSYHTTRLLTLNSPGRGHRGGHSPILRSSPRRVATTPRSPSQSGRLPRRSLSTSPRNLVSHKNRHG